MLDKGTLGEREELQPITDEGSRNKSEKVVELLSKGLVGIQAAPYHHRSGSSPAAVGVNTELVRRVGAGK